MEKKRVLMMVVVVMLGVATMWAKDYYTVVFKVPQMMCQNCENKIKKNIKFEKGLKEFSTDLENKTVTITYDAEKTDVEKLKEGFKKFKYEVEVLEEPKPVAKKK